ncbi:hypothetical protein B0T14DRAFT_233365 [Immersiella caudata]|uniref:Uncharacterized protein n=1 Tax=Immersiella caudata TaxID=314043 RepID=A0AA39WSF7_9PEZI|nr:hypothetical protein B0T14DRAFT_233365 [Immersiella caudata]
MFSDTSPKSAERRRLLAAHRDGRRRFAPIKRLFLEDYRTWVENLPESFGPVDGWDAAIVDDDWDLATHHSPTSDASTESHPPAIAIAPTVIDSPPYVTAVERDTFPGAYPNVMPTIKANPVLNSNLESYDDFGPADRQIFHLCVILQFLFTLVTVLIFACLVGFIGVTVTLSLVLATRWEEVTKLIRKHWAEHGGKLLGGVGVVVGITSLLFSLLAFWSVVLLWKLGRSLYGAMARSVLSVDSATDQSQSVPATSSSVFEKIVKITWKKREWIR